MLDPDPKFELLEKASLRPSISVSGHPKAASPTRSIVIHFYCAVSEKKTLFHFNISVTEGNLSAHFDLSPSESLQTESSDKIRSVQGACVISCCPPFARDKMAEERPLIDESQGRVK
jgi:hypothetical protein